MYDAESRRVMAITEELTKLGQSARRLRDGADELGDVVAEIDRTLGELHVGFEYLHPRPLREAVIVTAEGKRVIEVAYLGYLPFRSEHHLVVKTVKILESKAAMSPENSGSVTPLLLAPRPIRHAAVDVLPEVVQAITRQLDELADAVDRRREVARGVLGELQRRRDG